MTEFDWSELNHLQVGRYAEYYVKMEFTRFGFAVYTSEVDDRGVDFVVRRQNGPFYEVQVKSLRSYGYLFVPKDKGPITRERLVAVVLFHQGKAPSVYLIPSLAWSDPNALLVSRDYVGKKSKPEWGIQASAKNQSLLDKYQFPAAVAEL